MDIPIHVISNNKLQVGLIEINIKDVVGKVVPNEIIIKN